MALGILHEGVHAHVQGIRLAPRFLERPPRLFRSHCRGRGKKLRNDESLIRTREKKKNSKFRSNAAVLGIGHEERIGACLGPPRPIFDGRVHEGGCSTDRQSQHQSPDVPLLVPRRSPLRKSLQPSACTRPRRSQIPQNPRLQP